MTKSDANPTPHCPAATSRLDGCARRLGLRLLLWVLILAANILVIVVVQATSEQIWLADQTNSNRLRLVVVGAWIVGLVSVAVGCEWVRVRNLRRKRRAQRRPRPAPPSSDRPFADRLSQYLEEQPQPALGAESSADRSRMAFFLARSPGVRRGPKPPSVIRAILMRIRQLLRGHA